MKKIIFVLISFFVLPITGYAAKYCDNQTESTFRTLVANVNIAYEIDTDRNGNPFFTIYLTNLGSDMFIIDLGTGDSYKGFSEAKSELVIKTTVSGRHSFEFYSLKCKSKVGTKRANIPKYNAYYLDPLCEGLENYKQCQKWSGYKASRSQFESDIQEIKDRLKKIEENREGTKVSHVWYSKIIKLIFKIWWLIIIIIGLSLAIYYYFKNRAKKKHNVYNV